tara:strand:- start:12 stop:281 length:270 start_codon:yes stop_codon:yes gene_type:complete
MKLKKYIKLAALLGVASIGCFHRLVSDPFRYPMALWLIAAIPSSILAAIAMYLWAGMTGANQVGEALGGALGIWWSFPVIGAICKYSLR